MLWFNGAAEDFYLGLDDGGDALFIGTDSTVGSNGAIIIDKKGGVSSDVPHVGMNATPNINDLVTIGGAFAGYSNTFGLRVEPTLTAKAGNNASVISVAGTLVEAGSGTHNLLFGTSFSAPTVTGGSAAVANTATVYVSGAMSPTVTGANYALWVDDGVSRFDGKVGIGGVTNPASYHANGDDLVVYSTGTTGITLATNDQSSGRGTIYMSDGTASDAEKHAGYITYLHSDNSMYFGTNGNASASFYLDANQKGIFVTDVQIGTGTAHDRKIVFDGNEHDFYVSVCNWCVCLRHGNWWN